LMRILFLFICLIYAIGEAKGFSPAHKEKEKYLFFQSALKLLNTLDSGDIDQTVEFFEPGFDRRVLGSQIFQTWGSLTENYGDFISFSSLSFRNEFPEAAVYGKIKFERRDFGLRLGFGPTKQIGEFRLITDLSKVPASSPIPRPYVDQQKYTAITFQVGSKKYPLKGKLYQPTQRQPTDPILLLTHDFGSRDLFHRVGVNAIFKDLAEGLATFGFSVFLYPKRSHVYGKDSSKPEINPGWEVLEDIYSSLYHLKNRLEYREAPMIHVAYGFSTFFVPYLTQKSLFDGYILLNPSFRNPLELLFEDQEFRAVFEGIQARDLEILASKIGKFYSGSLGEGEDLFGYPPSYFRSLSRYAGEPRPTPKLPFLAAFALSDHTYNSSDRLKIKGLLSGHLLEVVEFPNLNRVFHQSHAKNPELDFYTPGIVSPALIQTMGSWLKRKFEKTWVRKNSQSGS